ncbi:MAG: hypothetical protein ACRC7G_04595, partial [Beijerinckiaceae bacterium]
LPAATLPDGAMLISGNDPCILRGERLYRWRFDGDGESVSLDRGSVALVITPPSIVAVLSAGYRAQCL